MKKLITLVLLLTMLLCLGSCQDEKVESIRETLKINAWVLDSKLEGRGYWSYIQKHRAGGEWVFYDSQEKLHEDDVFKYDRLQLNQPRIMAPMGYKGMYNLNIWLDFDGIVEVEKENIDDHIRLSYSLDSPNEPWRSHMSSDNSFRVHAPTAISICPVGKFHNGSGLILNATLTNREYHIIVKAYELDGTLLVTARLKFVVLNDEGYPYEEYPNSIYAPNEERSRFVSVELISYEYSDIYKFDEELVETK